MPRLAMPRLAMPRLAMPRAATSGAATLSAGRRVRSLSGKVGIAEHTIGLCLLSTDPAPARERMSPRARAYVSPPERAGRPISADDAQIAAICRKLGATLATRNTSDFEGAGIDLLDPWRRAAGS